MKNIYGSIGYTILKNALNTHILIFADSHDQLIKCDNNIDIAKWLESKLKKKTKILLEEVSRNENLKLQELWPKSEHTQSLKKLFLNNVNKINPVDIRPFLIPFSLELDANDDIILHKYLNDIDLFFSLKHPFFIKKINLYNINIIDNTNIGNHYIIIKKKYYDFLHNNNKLLNHKINDIIKKYKSLIIDDINDLLDTIMEWYICTSIIMDGTSHIIHTGLAHSEKVVQLLISHYNFRIIKTHGVNSLNNNIYYKDGCVNLEEKYDILFG